MHIIIPLMMVMSARIYIKVSVSYSKSINLTLTGRDTIRGRYIKHLTYLWQYNKDKSIITQPSSHHYWHEHKSPSFIDCCREPTTQVLTVHWVPFINMGGNTTTMTFLLAISFYNSGYLNSEARNETSPHSKESQTGYQVTHRCKSHQW